MEKEFLQQLSALFGSLGFVYKKKSWYAQSDELIKIINLQKSNYSDLYYVNLAYYVRGIGCGEGDTCGSFPKEEHSHLSVRADTWLSEEEDALLKDAIIHREVEKTWVLFQKLIINFSDPVHSAGDLKDRINSDKRFKNSASRRLKEFFGMSVDE